ncbi:MAG: hypothetical protein GF334_08040 [Candidatus Altiarchaeales archaeon]|nr:hypothetical protein [Candidatus Altiarchaeales archaeon]
MIDEEKAFTVCPKCLGRDVSWDLSKESYAGGRIFNQKICNNCGFTSLLFPELTEREYDKLLKQKK